MERNLSWEGWAWPWGGLVGFPVLSQAQGPLCHKAPWCPHSALHLCPLAAPLLTVLTLLAQNRFSVVLRPHDPSGPVNEGLLSGGRNKPAHRQPC